MAVMVFGAVSANAGFMITDRAANTTQPECTVNGGGIFQDILGVIISEFSGVIVIDAATAGCSQADGFIIHDRDGVIVIDKQ